MAEILAPGKTAGERYLTSIDPMMRQVETRTQEAGELGALQKEQEARSKAEAARTKATTARKQAEEIRSSQVSKDLEKTESEMMGQAFIPTQDNARDLAGLFSLINVIGFAIGKGGKQNAMQAMHAMNGMLEGYQQGRSDLYKKEKDKFEANLKSLKTRSEILNRRLKQIGDLAAIDAGAADQEADALLAEQGADFYKQYKEKFGLAKLIEFDKEKLKSIQHASDLTEKEYQRAEDRKMREAQMAQTRELAMLRYGGGGGKPLKETEIRKIEGVESVADGLQKLKEDFKPAYASLGMLGFGADLSLEAKRRLGDEEGRKAVSWWSRYQQLQAPNRHALFGATLTGNELKNYQSFTARPGDDPKVVKDFLTDQINYINDVASGTRRSFEAAGYRVPEARPRDYFNTFSGGEGGGKYSMNQVINVGGKQYRVVGLSDPNDPDLEEVK